MTYARMMAHQAQNLWLNGAGGHAAALEAVETVIKDVIERCAQIADERCAAKACHQDAGSRIRELAMPLGDAPTGEPATTKGPR